jgi:RNA polymerase sigma-70 factor (ECF subfamily)
MLVMFHVEMLSYEEIAAALDLPIGTVKSRLNRARVALREQLAPNEELFQIN